MFEPNGQGVSFRKDRVLIGGTRSQGKISSKRWKNERAEEEDIGR
jgi:hypothetical protein